MALALSVPAQAAGSASENARFDNAVEAVSLRVTAIDSVEGRSPARAIIMVRRGAAPVVDVAGRSAFEDGVAVDQDTPFYIASMTKAFVGLMALRLDRAGIMPLDTPLGEIFPEMRVEGIDLMDVTLEDALSHQLGFTASPLNIRTAYTDEVDPGDYGRIITLAGDAHGEAFQYNNLGYLIYGAALERHTGVSWRKWMDHMVLAPLQMRHSSTRATDFAAPAFLHRREGDGFQQFAPKPDSVMHAAGGLMVSPADMATFLLAQVGDSEGIPLNEIEDAQTSRVQADIGMGPLRCSGYALGWYDCEAFGMRVLMHGGGYVGMRAGMVVLPDEGVAFAALFNSDAMTGGLSQQLIGTFLLAYSGNSERLPEPKAMAGKYAQSVVELGQGRREEAGAGRLDERWGGFAWKPTRAQTDGFVGTYTSPIFGILKIANDELGTTGSLNGTGMTLEPAREGLFAAQLVTDAGIEPLEFVSQADGSTKVMFLGHEFVRQSQAAVLD